MLELFTETRGRSRLAWFLVLLLANLILFFLGIVWFWLWAVAGVLFFSIPVGEF